MQNFQLEFFRIQHHNMLHESGQTSFTRDVWDKSDITSKQKRTFLNGLAPIDELPTTRFSDDFEFQRGPSRWDWRRRSLDWTSVKDQGTTCGCCWAIVALQSLSSQIYKKTGQQISFSEQNLIDCNKNDDSGNWKCNVRKFKVFFADI